MKSWFGDEPDIALSCRLQADEDSRVHLSTFEDALTHHVNDSVVSHFNIHSLPLFLSCKESSILTKAILIFKTLSNTFRHHGEP